MSYKVIVNDKCIKEYPFLLQAKIYCLLNKYVNTGRGWYFLDPRVRIEKCIKKIK